MARLGSLLALTATLPIACSAGVWLRPGTNTNDFGADPQANIGSSVNDPALAQAPSAQWSPILAPPEEKHAGAGLVGPSGYRASESGMPDVRSEIRVPASDRGGEAAANAKSAQKREEMHPRHPR